MALTVAMVMVAGCVVEEEDGPNRGNNNTGGGSITTGWYDRNPSAANFTVSTAAHLVGLAELVNGGNSFEGKTITMANDISLSAYNAANTAFNNGRGWVPIGNASNRPFSGIFNGNDHVVSGLFFNHNTSDRIGLFGTLNGTVKNLGVVDVDIFGRGNVGALAGFVGGDASVDNCYSTGLVRGAGNGVGGLIGQFSGAMQNCYSTATLSGINSVGGLMGENSSGSISTSYSTGAVNGTNYVGGLVGSHRGTLANCYSTSTVRGSNAVGGLIGHISATTSVTNCYATGDVGGESRVGGIAGANGGVMTLALSAALNPNLNINAASGFARVAPFATLTNGATGGRISGCVALIDMNHNGEAMEWTQKDASHQNGADIVADDIHSDPTMGNRFTELNGWTLVPGYLPGLFGVPVEMPAHLR